MRPLLFKGNGRWSNQWWSKWHLGHSKFSWECWILWNFVWQLFRWEKLKFTQIFGKNFNVQFSIKNAGGSKCKCKNRTMRTFRSFSSQGRNAVCKIYCANYKRTLKGCSTCAQEVKTYQPLFVNNNRLPSAPSPNPVMVPQAQSENIQYGVQQMMREVNIPTVPVSLPPTQATTPDWNLVCQQLCRSGQGGALCNCDFAPFWSRKHLLGGAILFSYINPWSFLECYFQKDLLFPVIIIPIYFNPYPLN